MPRVHMYTVYRQKVRSMHAHENLSLSVSCYKYLSDEVEKKQDNSNKG